jgi:hypothetical protein
MSGHIWNLVCTAWEMLRNALSTSNLSLVVFSLCVPLAVFIVAVLLKWSESWTLTGLMFALQASVKPAVVGTAVTFAAWVCLFSWALYRSVYNDHNNLIGRLRTVVNEKNALKTMLVQRDEYIKTLEMKGCPPCKGSGGGIVLPVEEKISSVTVEARMTCTIKEDAPLPPSTVDIMAGFGTGQLVGPAGTAELARTNPVEFRKQRNNEMVVVNHFFLPSSEGLMGSPISRISNYEKMVIPITVLGSVSVFDRISLVEVTVTVNNKHTWYYPYKLGAVAFQDGGPTVTIPLAGIGNTLK